MADIFSSSVSIEAGDSGSVSLPDGFDLATSNFEANGSDLVVTGADGSQVVVEGFYEGGNPPDLMTADGGQVSGEMVVQLAGSAPEATSVTADSGSMSVISGTDGEPIGNVENMSGEVWAIRADGSRVELNVGDSVYQGDVLESGPQGAVGVLLADETTFSMGEGGRMVLDEMIYDPGTQEGSVSISVLQGVFTFVSGQVAKTDPDAMTLDTPVATIGIRGTQVGLDVGGGEDLNVVLMEEADGFVGEVVITNDGGTQVLNVANQMSTVSDFTQAPGAIEMLDMQALIDEYATALEHLPLIHGNQNDFGLQGGGGSDLNNLDNLGDDGAGLDNFDTAAGEEEKLADDVEFASSELQQFELIQAGRVEFDLAPSQLQAQPLDFLRDPSEVFAGPEPIVIPAGFRGIPGPGGVTIYIPEEIRGALYSNGVIIGSVSGNIDLSGYVLPTGVTGFHLTGIDGVNTIISSSGDDVVFAQEANDVVDAGAGNDILVGGSGLGDDTYIGGEGVDTITYASAEEGFQLYINLALGTAYDVDESRPWINMDTLIGIENVIGGSDSDTIIGDDGANRLDGGAGSGNDTLDGGAGDDVLIGGDGDDLLIGGAGRDTAIFSSSIDDVSFSYVENADGVLQLTVTTMNADGSIASVDTLSGIETLQFSDATIPVVEAEAAAGVVTGTDGDDLIAGSSGDDILSGGAGDDIIIGGAGDDTIDGGTGDDILDGGAGDDVLLGSDGADTLDGGVGDDVLIGGGGDDVLIGGAGDDYLDGGDGFDTALYTESVSDAGFSYAFSSADGGVISLTITNPDGTQSVDTLRNIEALEFADAEMLIAEAVSVDGATILLDLPALIDNADGAETLRFNGMPEGSTLSLDGVLWEPNADGSYDIPPSGLSVATLTLPPGFVGDVAIEVVAYDVNGNVVDSGLVTLHAEINFDPADLPELTVSAATGDEDSAITLDISSAVTDVSETLSVTISDIPEGAVLSAGTVNADGSVTLTPEQLAGLTITPPADSNVDFNLTVTATSTSITGDTIDNVQTLSVDVTGVADGPTLSVTETVAGMEDGAIALGIDAGLVDTDGSETLSVTISGMPDGATLSAGTDNGDGTWTLAAGDLADLKVTPPEDFSGDFTLSVSATATEDDGDAATTELLDAITVSVEAVADAPTLTVGAVTGGEDTAIALDIGAGLTDTDGSETLSVTISGLPEGAVLSAGTLNPDGSYTLTTTELDGLTMTPPENFTGSLSLDVTATSTEANGDTAQTTGAISVSVGSVADAPTLGVSNAAGLEDGEIALNIDAQLTDASESLSVTIAGVPAGATLSAGTLNSDGTYTLTGDELVGLTITPAANSSDDFSLSVTATSTTADGQTASSGPFALGIDVAGVADAPTLTVGAVSGDEDTAIALDIGAGLTDTDGSETLSVTITGVPEGAVLSAGTLNADGSYTLAPDQLAGLTVTPPDDFSGDFSLTVTATSIEADGDTAETVDTIAVSVEGVADAPTLEVTASTGGEDTAIALNINAALTDTDGSESLSITIGGLPDGATLSAGTLNPDGSYTLTAAQLDGLTMTPPADYSGEVDLTVTAISTEASGDTAETVDRVTVTIDDSADAPTLNVGNSTGYEDKQIALDIGANLTDVSETLSITIAGVPAGAVLSAGVDNGDGTYTLTPSDLTGLTITPPDDSNVDFSLSVSATSTTASGDTAVTGPFDVAVDVVGVADAPVLSVQATSGIPTGVAREPASDGDLTGSNNQHEVIGTDGDDVIQGGNRAEFIDGGAGDDVIGGEGGADDIFGGDGDDVISGGEGADNLSGGAGDDVLVGGKGADQLRGGAGDDIIDGGEGTEHSGSSGDEVMFTGDRHQYIITQNDNGSFNVQDIYSGRDGVDTVMNVENFTFADGTIDIDDVLTTNPVTYVLDIESALADTDGSETLSATINVSGLPLGAELTAGTQNADGSWTVEMADVGGLGVLVPYDAVQTFSLSVSATSTENDGDTATTVTTIDIDGPATDDVVGYEDEPIALDIDTQLATGDELVSITVASAPPGAVLSAGVQNPDGTYTLSADDLIGLTVTAPPDSSIDFTLDINVTSVNAAGEVTETNTITTVDVIGVADQADLTVADAVGVEDTAVALDISAGLNDTDGSETLSITISGVPAGATLSAGYDNGDGSWTLGTVDLEGLTLNPPVNSNVDFDLEVTATTKEIDGDIATTTTTLSVDMTGVADAGAVSAADASGGEDQWIQLNLDSAASSDTDGSETISITITGVPAGATLSPGTELAEGVWTTTAADLSNVSVLPPEDFSGDFNLTLSLTTTENDGDSATVSTVFTVSVSDDADAPDLVVKAASGDEDSVIALDISAATKDQDGSETLSVTISGVPLGAVLSAGLDNGDGTWTLSADDLSGLSVTPPADSNVDFDLTVTAESTDTSGDTASTTGTIHVDVAGVADAPSVIAAVSGPVHLDAVDPVEGVVIDGGEGGDILAGGAGDDVISGDKGEDFLVGGAGDDELSGGKGEDRLIGGDGDDVLDGGQGDDLLVGGTGDDVMDGGEGKDAFVVGVGQGNDVIDGGLGSDTLVVLDVNGVVADPSQWTLSLDAGSYTQHGDRFDLSSDAKGTITLEDGTVVTFDNIERIDWSGNADIGSHDTATFATEVGDSITTGNDEDNLIGSAGDDVLRAGGNEDFLSGGAGDDVLTGGDKDDLLMGDAGNDTLEGGEGGDVLIGGAGDDVLDGGSDGHGHHGDHADDIAVFSGNRDQYQVTRNPDGTYTVVDLVAGRDGADTARNIEVFQFADGSVDEGDITDTNPTEPLPTGGSVFNLTIDASLADTDGSETLSIQISGIPEGASLSAGADNGDGSYTLTAAQLEGLTLQVDEGVTDPFDIGINVVSTENDGDSASAVTSLTIDPGAAEGESLIGTSAADTLEGGSGDDYIAGMEGDDVLKGGAGDDVLKGGDGDDVLIGGAGDDVLSGGAGTDTFIFDAESGNDIVTDIINQDTLVFEGQEFDMDDLVLTENEVGDVVVSFGNVEGTSVTLDGVSMDDMNKGSDGGGYSVTEDEGAVTVVIDNIQ